MNTPEHQYVGPLLHDRIIGALELSPGSLLALYGNLPYIILQEP